MVSVYEAEIDNGKLTLIETGTIKNPPTYRGLSRHNPSLFAKYMCEYFHMDTLPIEVAYLIAFNEERKPIGVIKVAEGNEREIILPIRSIVGRLVLLDTHYFIMFHNHPDTYGNDIKIFGGADKRLTYNLIKAGYILTMSCADHIIIGSDGFFSLRKETGFFGEVFLNYYLHEEKGVNLIGDDEEEEIEEDEDDEEYEDVI